MHSPILFNDALLLGLAKLACQITRFAEMRRAPARFPPVLPSIQTQQLPPPPPLPPPPHSLFLCTWLSFSLLLDLVDSLVYICIRCDWSNVINVFCVFQLLVLFLCRYCNYRAVFPAWVQIWRATARADYVRKYSNQLSQKKRPLVSLSGYDD